MVDPSLVARKLARVAVLALAGIGGCTTEDSVFDCSADETVAHERGGSSIPPPQDFYRAAREGDLESVQKHLLSGIDLDGADAEVTLYVENGYEARAGRASGLILAANGGHFDVAQALVCAGANINAKTARGDTALHRATDRGDERLVQALLAYGADPELPESVGLTRALHTASGNGEVGIVEALLDAGANPNAMAAVAITPLQIAINEDNDTVVELLLERGASPDPQTKEYWTSALHIAVVREKESLVRLLLSHQANPNVVNNEGSTPLLEAVAEGKRSIAELLLKAGADPNVRNYHLDSALGWAVLKDNTDLVRTLLDNGADPLLEDRDGETALVFAKSEDVRELLSRAAGKSAEGKSEAEVNLTVPAGARSVEIVALVRRSNLLKGDLEPEQLREGWLAPGDYKVAPGTARSELVAMMVARQEGKLSGFWDYRAQNLPLGTPTELLVLASLVECAAPAPEFFDPLASVLVNRLRHGMKLQLDAALIYGITRGEAPLERPLRKSDLEQDTPWNTYLNQGLPPTPICAPSTAAIGSASHPPATDYLFFVSDASGGLVFAETLSEHNENVAKIR